MVKIPQDSRPKRRVIFRDAKGRFVAEAERYKKATNVYKLYRGKYVPIIEHAKRITPKRLSMVLTQTEFEDLPPSYGKTVTFIPKVKKYTAWDIAGQLDTRPRGFRGRMVRVEMVIRHGKATRKITFFRRFKRKGEVQIGFWMAMNKALANEKTHLYNRIGSKLFPDRKGKAAKLVAVNITPEI